MVGYVTHGHIYHPRTGFIRRTRGIASGSVFTNLVDSLANVFILYYSTALMACRADICFKVGGDDNVIYSREFINPQTVAYNVKMLLNMDLNFKAEHCFNKGVPNMHFLGSL